MDSEMLVHLAARLDELEEEKERITKLWLAEEQDLIDQIDAGRLSLRAYAPTPAQHAGEQALIKKIDAARLAQKPDFPTPSQHEAITTAAQLVRDGVKHGDHLGDAVAGDPSVCYSSQGHRINIYATAPWSASGAGHRLWEFTDDEVNVFTDAILATGLRITHSWRHDDGVGFVVAVAKTE